MKKLEDLNEIKHKLIEAVEMELAGGIQNVDTAELGEVIDMIKDCAEAEKDCMKACYYELICEAMTEDGEEGSYGYDRYRYASGRFAPKGRGHISGYLPSPMMDDDVMRGSGRSTMRTNMPMTRSDAPMGYDKAMHEGMEPKDRLDDAIDLMSDIWAKADAHTKTEMKSMVEDLLDQMKHSM